MLYDGVCFIVNINILMKFVQSILGFKSQRSPVLQARNSILKLLLIIQPLNIIIFWLVNSRVSQPYMDQVFHHDQFSHYLHNDFRYWNNKITTPPGLYYVNLAFSYLFDFGMNPLVYSRFLNVFLYSNVTLLFFLKVFEEKDINENNSSRSLVLALTPTIYFFNFLNYTDSASLMFMTMAFYYNLTNSRKRLLLCSIFGIMVRQNNIVWLGYLACYRLISDKRETFSNNRTFISHIYNIVKTVLSNKTYVLKTFKYQILLLIGFYVYIKKYNKGRLVFGDVQNHVVSFHPTQIFYFSLFACVNLPLNLREIYITTVNLFKRIYYSRHALSTFLFLVSASLILIDKYTIVHKFILSDNRHYIFYIWKDILSHPILRYSMCIVYSISFIFIFRLIVNSQQKLLKVLLHLFFTFLVLTVTGLVEFRYFTLPLVYLSFEITNKSKSLDIQGIHWKETYGTLDRMYPVVLARVAVNVAVMYVFLYREFGEDKSRFMW